MRLALIVDGIQLGEPSSRIRRRQCLYALGALVFPSALFGAKYPEYPVRAAKSYPNAVAQSGLVAAAEALSDPKAQKEYFHLEFAKKNYLPVFVVLENHSPAESFIVKQEDIGVYSGTAKAASAGAGDVASGRSKVGEGITYSLPGPALAVVANLLIRNAADVRQNVVKNQLRSVTLSPGQAAHGFVYIPLPKGAYDAGQLRMRVRVYRTGEEQPLDLKLPLQ